MSLYSYLFRSVRILLVSLLASTLVETAGAAGLTIDSQTRSVVADGLVEESDGGIVAGMDEDSQFLDEPGTGTFDATVSADAEYESLEAGFATGSGTQNSEINMAAPSRRLEASGSGAAGMGFDILDIGSDSYSEAAGDSYFEVVFTLEEPAEYSLTASLSTNLDALTLVSGPGPIAGLIASFIELSGASGGIIGERTVVDVNVDDEPVEALVGNSGVLAPDTYTLLVGAVAEGSGFEDAFGGGVAAFGFELVVTVPEPGSVGMHTVAVVTLSLVGLARQRRRIH